MTIIGSAKGNTFQMLDGCICPGHNVTFECTTVGGGITVWEGTAFDCPLSSNEIQLRHTQFIDSIRICNNGDISGHAVAILPPDCFLSRLIVHITMELNGRTVICRHDDGVAVHTVNTSVLTITRGNVINITQI